MLTDWALERLVYSRGPVAAERVVSGAAVLIFFWGAFFAVDATTGRRPWLFSPLLAMLSYGLVFHFGFLNFYLSVGSVFLDSGTVVAPLPRACDAGGAAARAGLAGARPSRGSGLDRSWRTCM